MDVSRRGKIARLPRNIREELNRRLRDGESGTKLLAWLNALPEVQCIVAQEFGGRPVHAQNLTVWRRSGYKDWLQMEQAAELVRHPFTEADELKSVLDEPASDKLGTWLAARYAVATQHMAREGNGQLDWEQLREMCSDVSALRRGDHRAARLKLEQARSELEHERDAR
jgi:hypothetical protein